jgi:hypothetical protein
LIQAVILKFDSSILTPTGANTPLIYPYFFVNLETEGLMVLVWIIALAAVFAAVGYAFYGLDRLIKSKK